MNTSGDLGDTANRTRKAAKIEFSAASVVANAGDQGWNHVGLWRVVMVSGSKGQRTVMDDVRVERLGGLSGFGGAGSRLRSSGHLRLRDLSDDDREKLKGLFCAGPKILAHGADGFSYRITWTGSCGVKVIELAEGQVPAALVNCVVARLK